MTVNMIPATEIRDRVKRIRSAMECEGIDALFVSGLKNIEYLSGKDTGRILITHDAALLWSKDLYIELYSPLYADPAYPFEVLAYEKDAIKKKILGLGLQKLHVGNVSFGEHAKLSEDLGIDVCVTGVIEKQRSFKSDYELEMLKKAAGIAVKGMEKAYEVIKDGVPEIYALADIECEIRRQGSESPPFADGMLLSSGVRSADIHARASFEEMRSGEAVVVDLGAKYGGYFSDMTRTIPIGDISGADKELLLFVKSLEDEAIDRLKEGSGALEIHEFVEGRMREKGYKFHHSTGHGVGLDVHEAPNLGPGSEDTLLPGMVFTIEPGVYIPGRFGVRFEDMVYLKKNCVEVLTGMGDSDILDI